MEFMNAFVSTEFDNMRTFLQNISVKCPLSSVRYNFVATINNKVHWCIIVQFITVFINIFTVCQEMVSGFLCSSSSGFIRIS